MIKEKNLPHNKKEGLLYGSTIAIITVLFMVILNTYINLGTISYIHIPQILKLIIILFIIAMLLENFVVSYFVNKLNTYFVHEKDSFNARILFTILFTVIGMSFTMTWIAPFVSSGFELSTISFNLFISNWPKNFGIVFALELLIAQPLARKLMVVIHK
ncbi:DUF2798 domain-containing protein [Vagococcus fluvialis]|uniref:DUF2798 domain-containing protein n=1 Tax=Vagococcus fluvialis TaxID=2738 RepID=UPI001F5CF328|nr:DUF2798 domain-containing protein [Vagococcus fluvialis]